MTIYQIALMGGISFSILTLIPVRWRSFLMFSFSILGLFWMQPGTSALFPLLSLLVIIMVWWVVKPAETPRHFLVWLAVMVGIGLGLKSPVYTLTAQFSVMGVLAAGILASLAAFSAGEPVFRQRFALILVAVIAAVLLLLKTLPVVHFLEQYLYAHTGSSQAVQWIGLSYMSFRVMAVLIDFRQDRLLELRFEDFVIYVLFPAAWLAGPIDRAERFIPDLQAHHPLDAERFIRGGRRIVSGMVRKFVIADSLALAALSPQVAADAHSMFGAWLVVYLYTFQIFFDFSGYSEIAIGLGTWAGIDLLENFNRPYLQQNLALFWQNWHMTLTGWLRAYFFLPFSRWLIRKKLPVSPFLITQITTMTLIGLWHGAQGNFALWGLWHALGLYFHDRLAAHTKSWYMRSRQIPWKRRLIYVGGVVATFHYVAVGWVFFVLPQPFEFLRRMVGL